MQQADAIPRIKHSESTEDLPEQSLHDRAFCNNICKRLTIKEKVENIILDSRHIFTELEHPLPPESYEITEIMFIYETEPEIDAVMTRAQRLREDQLVQNKDDFPLLDISDTSNAKQAVRKTNKFWIY